MNDAQKEQRVKLIESLRMNPYFVEWMKLKEVIEKGKEVEKMITMETNNLRMVFEQEKITAQRRSQKSVYSPEETQQIMRKREQQPQQQETQEFAMKQRREDKERYDEYMRRQQQQPQMRQQRQQQPMPPIAPIQEFEEDEAGEIYDGEDEVDKEMFKVDKKELGMDDEEMDIDGLPKFDDDTQ